MTDNPHGLVTAIATQAQISFVGERAKGNATLMQVNELIKAHDANTNA